MTRSWLVALLAVGCTTGAGSDGLDTGLDGVPASAVALEDAVLVLVNEARAQGGDCAGQSFPPSEALESDALLRTLARDHSIDMAERDYVDHVNPDGDGPFERMEDGGFTGALPWGENVAAGQQTADRVMADWMASPGHCVNILEPGFAVIGIGVYEDDSILGTFWTQKFAGSH